jgi:hypothetical protein
MNNEKIADFIKQTGEQVIIDCVNGRFCVENSSMVLGKKGNKLFIKGVGETLDVAIDNFCYEWERNKTLNNSVSKYNNAETYYWHSSY